MDDPIDQPCALCGWTLRDHEFVVDETQAIGWYGPVPAYQPAATYFVCPISEDFV